MSDICKNKYLNEISKEVDTLYHLNLNTKDYDLKKIFGNVKVLVTGGTPSRIKKVAELVHQKYEIEEPLIDYSVKGGRYSLFVTGHVLQGVC